MLGAETIPSVPEQDNACVGKCRLQGCVWCAQIGSLMGDAICTPPPARAAVAHTPPLTTKYHLGRIDYLGRFQPSPRSRSPLWDSLSSCGFSTTLAARDAVRCALRTLVARLCMRTRTVPCPHHLPRHDAFPDKCAGDAAASQRLCAPPPLFTSPRPRLVWRRTTR